MNASDKLSLEFTVEEWRLISAACMAVKPSSLVNGEKKKPVLAAIAVRIATQTGKGG